MSLNKAAGLSRWRAFTGPGGRAFAASRSALPDAHFGPVPWGSEDQGAGGPVPGPWGRSGPAETALNCQGLSCTIYSLPSDEKGGGNKAMTSSLSAQKRGRQNAKCRARNRWRKASVRTAIKDYRHTVLHGPVEDAEAKLTRLYRLLDQVAMKGTIHKNTAARYKSRLAGRLNAKKSAADA